MGNSPGLANIFVKLCADELLDEVRTADICHIHGGEPSEGAAVLKHRIHAMVNDIPLFIDGEFISVRQLDPSGAEHVREIDFAGVGTYPAYPYPHPETITLPATIPTLERATNLGVVYPLSYFDMTQDLVRAGMSLEEAIDVGGTEVAPIDVMVALLQHERPRLLEEAGVTGPGGCLRAEVGGIKDGEQHNYICSLTSAGSGAGEGTGIPAALGAALHLRGSLGEHPGVHPPEAIVPVGEVLDLAGEVVGAMDLGGGGSSGIPLTVQHTGPDGAQEIIPMTFG
ncbi:MAG: saccharopine dehydrogenase C-terminal domain-containing protein [Microthrixaceae bacterium]